ICRGPSAGSTASVEQKRPKAGAVHDCHAAPNPRNRVDNGASNAAPGAHSAAAAGRLRVRSASRPQHSQSLSPVETLSDSLSPSSQGDKVSLQLRGDIILEHLQCRAWGLDALPAIVLYFSP